VGELVGSVFFGLADVITNGVVCSRLLHGELALPNEAYKMGYAAILCLGVVTIVTSIAYRIRNAMLVRAQVLEVGRQGLKGSESEARRRMQLFEYELEQTHRTMVVLSLSLLTVLTQGAVLQVSCSPARKLAERCTALRSGCRCRGSHVHPELLSPSRQRRP
jgi:hypothetical protein